MDKQQAREKLQFYRPGTDDDRDPEMAEALCWARQDHDLANWFENHCNVYLALRHKLKEIPVPRDLKREILREDAARRGRIVALWNPMMPLAAAAAAVVLGVALWTSFKGSAPENFRACRERVVLESQRGYQMVANTNLSQIHTRLLANACPDYSLTPALARLKAEGYASLQWHNHKVSMVCLKAALNKDLFLFVMDAPSLGNAPATGEMEFAKIHRLNSASWSAQGKIYILAGPLENADLKQYLD